MNERFGRWVIVELRGRWAHCRCDCGVERAVRAKDLRFGKSKSCGCLREELAAISPRTHGHCSSGRRHPLYGIWQTMISRCTREKSADWKDYGGRGIKVCERWLGPEGFVNFLADVGERPTGATLEREDNDGDYEPTNIHWASRQEQAQNTRTTKLTWDIVREIRGRHEHGERPASIARRLGQSDANVRNVINLKTWKEIAMVALLAASAACCPTLPPTRPQPVLVVPSADSHCLSEPPPGLPPVVAELASLPPTSTATRAQLDELASFTADLLEYGRRAWRDCGIGAGSGDRAPAETVRTRGGP